MVAAPYIDILTFTPSEAAWFFVFGLLAGALLVNFVSIIFTNKHQTPPERYVRKYAPFCTELNISMTDGDTVIDITSPFKTDGFPSQGDINANIREVEAIFKDRLGDWRLCTMQELGASNKKCYSAITRPTDLGEDK